jgi:hypothetical protein
MTVTAARVARDIDQKYGGSIGKDDLLLVMSEHGVNQQGVLYVDKMLTWGYLYYDHIEDVYRLTDESKQTAMIIITVPRLNAKEIRRDLVGRYAGYAGVIEVGEVQSDE